MINRLTRKKLIIVAILVYIVFFFIFYPKFITISDEHGYLRQTYELSKGRISVDDPFYSYKYFYRVGRFVPSYPIGTSVILLPFSLISWKLVFLSGFILHLFNMYILAKILSKYKINKFYSLLYILYPGFIFYSRTIMSEIPSITFILLGFYFFLNKNKKYKFLAGLMWGISCIVRPTNALVIIGMCLPTLYESFVKLFKYKKVINKDSKILFYIALGIIPALVISLAYNYFVYGGILNQPHSAGNLKDYSKVFTFTYDVFKFYWKPILIMLVVYPLMLISPFIAKFKKKREIILVTLLFLILFGKSNIIRYGWLTNLVVGHRYFFPIIPLILIPYSIFIKKYFKRFIILGIIALIIVTPIIMYRQSIYTNQNYDVMEQIYNVIPEGSVITVYAHSDMNYLNNFFGENYKVMHIRNFQLTKYEGAYYLVHYFNQALKSNVRKESDLQGFKSYESLFNDVALDNKFKQIYKNDDLVIYYNAGQGYI